MQDIKRFVAGGLFMKKKLKRALCAGLCAGTVLPVCIGCAEQKPDYTNFEIVLGETVIVAQGEPGKFDWGYVQFPGLLVCSWESLRGGISPTRLRSCCSVRRFSSL